MKSINLLTLMAGSALSAGIAFSEAPPAIPSGSITYTAVNGQTDYADDFASHSDYATPTPAAAPRQISAYSNRKWATLDINAYSSNYQVRGMGVTNRYSDAGWSSVNLQLKPGNTNLFGWGIGHQLDLQAGAIYGSGVLGNEPVLGAGYGLTKEIFPNLLAKAGYGLQYGGLEGFLSEYRGKAPHQLAQNFHINLTYDDRQTGYFGRFDLGAGFYGLTGWYGLIEGGYRWQDVLPTRGNIGWDATVRAGMSYSFGYWAGNADGVDAYYIRCEALPYNIGGTMGRDAQWQLVPWVQTSWAGNNRTKINQAVGTGIIDHFQFTAGVDVRYNF